MTHYHEQITSVIESTIFQSPLSYSWFGRQTSPFSLSISSTPSYQDAREHLLFNLKSQLYKEFYCKGFAINSKEDYIDIQPNQIPKFIQKLSLDNFGEGYLEDGWNFFKKEQEKIIIHKENLKLWVSDKECLLPQNISLLPNQQLKVKLPKEFLSISTGFYLANSNRPIPESKSNDWVRFYWNIVPEGALILMRKLTQTLNQYNIPFKLKVLNNPALYNRCDAAVLYIMKQDFGEVSRVLRRIYPEIVTYLKNGIPALTKLLAPGLGLAEQPRQGKSFGKHRCKLLAEGMLVAYEQGKESVDERLQVVKDLLKKEGISLNKPFLNPNSIDIYNFHINRDKLQICGDRYIEPYKNLNEQNFLKTANEIGQRLVRDAIWYKDRCNWIGLEDKLSSVGKTEIKYTCLGPDLYLGTSGIALFMTELYLATGDRRIRSTAIGAIKQSLYSYKIIPCDNLIGLYTGLVGIVFAAVRVGKLLKQEEIVHDAMNHLKNFMKVKQEKQKFDVISGRAGAIVAIRILTELMNDKSLFNFALCLGEELIQAADKTENGYSWGTGNANHQNLTGFSHGTAGVGYALLELYKATDNSSYREAAENAFNYERFWFDSNKGNWPDFRNEYFSSFWCHGAPGIALSRLRAYEILKNKIYKTESVTALETTKKIINKLLYSGTQKLCLCHGLAGNAESLIYGYEVLGDSHVKEYKLALEVGTHLQKLYTSTWSNKALFSHIPGLMTGSAGIGYFFLRLQNPKIPSLLILRSEDFLI
ncbi:hypothetical protein BK726_17325 [Bacillus thuringiensis serovar londrina]|uniref:lanthionine synthetase LanC family protein n=1 Tax=Bacillus thuringiensis TaxID=1428 RepID=UPI000B448EC5|nr:lanthionine synthetase LanC family protein [Bacillus thuringiensis]OTX87122.1 hypothetical protein BK726_17325 [Bacillus thuringiensis serovar londrina]